MVDARISGEVRRVIHRRYHIHDYRFESCPDYKRVSYSKKNKQNRDPKGCVGSSPTEEATPDGGIGRHTGQKNGNP